MREALSLASRKHGEIGSQELEMKAQLLFLGECSVFQVKCVKKKKEKEKARACPYIMVKVKNAETCEFG